MRYFVMVWLLCVTTAQGGETPGKYANVPQSAKSLLTALKRLDSRLEIGATYATYSTEVENFYIDMKMFVGSKEGQQYPELCFMLRNCADCYVLVRDYWSDSIRGSSAVDRYKADLWLISGRPVLWQIARTNIAGINVLLNDTPQAVDNFLKQFPDDMPKLTLLSGALIVVRDARTHKVNLVEKYFQVVAKQNGSVSKNRAKVMLDL